MSDETNPLAQGGEDTLTASVIGDNKLQCVLGAKLSPPLHRKIEAAQGRCPPDEPYWNGQTTERFDRRSLPRCTMRFTACKNHEAIRVESREDEIRSAVWHAVGYEMNKQGMAGSLPTVIVERHHLDDTEAKVCIDISFDESNYLVFMNSIYEIQLKKADGAPWVLPRSVLSNTLDADIIPFDVLRLPLTEDNGKLIWQSLNHMVSALGSVVGFGNLVYTDKILDKLPRPSTIIRGYLKLSRPSMTMPFEELCLSIPTHLQWEGRLYTLRYAGRDYHKTPLHSADYPLEEVTEESGEAETRLSTPSRSSTISNGQSSTLVDIQSGAKEGPNGSK